MTDVRTGAIKISDGTIEALKWLAITLMVLDHLNKFVYEASLPVAFELGRICLPIFAFVLGYNLARGDSLENGFYIRVITRLGIFGLAATPAFFMMSPYWWPLNIMFMLLLATLCIFLLDSGGALNVSMAILLFVVGSLVVEFFWWGTALCIFSWQYCRKPQAFPLIGFVVVAASLWVVNGNFYALLAIPIIYGAQFVSFPVPRWRYAFYSLYPIHLTLLLAVTKLP